MKHDVILRIGAKLILPFILLFAFYVQFHGDYGPGGGFQAGVMSAGMLILYSIVFGNDALNRVAPRAVVERFVPIGALLFATVGLAGPWAGKRYLDYTPLAHDVVHAREWGILLVEVGVFITVAATMTTIYYAFTERGQT
ncbi:MAG: Na(+)/H(+) antiporter subunit B [Alphaproteobacteria bacterium]|nr:Na(+)/H(+) antiporter subunit B [Alphaproteobacteria bacterium]